MRFSARDLADQKNPRVQLTPEPIKARAPSSPAKAMTATESGIVDIFEIGP
jgi:hypothetical protein